MERAMVSRGRKGERRRDGARLAKIEFARNRDADDSPGDRIFYSRGFGRDSGVGFAGLVSRVSAWGGGWGVRGEKIFGGGRALGVGRPHGGCGDFPLGGEKLPNRVFIMPAAGEGEPGERRKDACGMKHS